MTRNIEQVNSLLQKEIAEIINKEFFINNALITVSYVDCSPDLNNANVAVSILPDNLSGSALEILKKNSSKITAILKKRIKFRAVPHFRWIIDETEKNAAVIEDILRQIKEEE